MWQFGWEVGSCWNRTGGRSSHLTDWKLEDLQSVQGCCQNIYRQSCKLHIKYHLTQLQQQLLLAESGWRLRRRYRKRPGACTPAYEMKSCNPCGWFHMQMWLPPESQHGWSFVYVKLCHSPCEVWSGWGSHLCWRFVSWFSNYWEAPHTHRHLGLTDYFMSTMTLKRYCTCGPSLI